MNCIRIFSRVSRAAVARPILRCSSIAANSTTRSGRNFKQHNNIDLMRNAALATLLASSATVTALADANYTFREGLLDEDLPSVLYRAEPQTGVDFPLSLPSGESLHGTGVRLMGGLVRVYAVGLYVDARAARSALEDWVGFTKSDILSSEALWSRICDVDVPFKRVLRMVIVREVGGGHMRDGFERGLGPRVTAAAKKGKCKPAECKKALHHFTDMFVSLGTMKVGSEVRIAIDKGVVNVTVDGRWIGQIKNHQLAWALVDMFLGMKAVAPTLRKSTAEGLEHLLKE